MTHWFLYFVCYSFFGYLLEKYYARRTRSPRQVRKCFLLLPLCPVYGLAMCAVLATGVRETFWLQAAVGGAVCTGVEYLLHLFYDRALQVRFWDYTGVPGNVAGRICPRFAILWGLLSAAAVRWVQPGVENAAGQVPANITYALWLVLAADGICSAALLRRFGDTELLSLRKLSDQMRASSQSDTSR